MDQKKFIERLKKQKSGKVPVMFRVDPAIRNALVAFSAANKVSATAIVESLLTDLLGDLVAIERAKLKK